MSHDNFEDNVVLVFSGETSFSKTCWLWCMWGVLPSWYYESCSTISTECASPLYMLPLCWGRTAAAVTHTEQMGSRDAKTVPTGKPGQRSRRQQHIQQVNSVTCRDVYFWAGWVHTAWSEIKSDYQVKRLCSNVQTFSLCNAFFFFRLSPSTTSVSKFYNVHLQAEETWQQSTFGENHGTKGP